MRVICWNIRTNNADNLPVSHIVEAVAKVTDLNSPWLLAILENKSGGDSVGELLCAELKGRSHRAVAAGGGIHTSENVVFVAGGGTTVISAEPHTEWQDLFGAKYNLDYLANVALAESNHQAKLGQGRPSMQAARDAQLEGVKKDVPWDPTNCRNPVVVSLSDGERFFKFGFVHSPGPREGVGYSAEKYAITYFSCIMKSLQDLGLDGLMGDFNIYGSEPPRSDASDLRDISGGLGGTTFKKATGAVGDSRLDRAYLASRYALHSEIAIVNGGRQASDHVGVSIDLKSCKHCWEAYELAVAQGKNTADFDLSALHLLAEEASKATPLSESGAGVVRQSVSTPPGVWPK